MENLTIKKIIQKIKKINIQDIIQLKNEEGNGYYNVWKVVTFESNYILKQTTEKELNNKFDEVTKEKCRPSFCSVGILQFEDKNV